MKKVSVILLLSIYSFATLGIEVKQFYCCGKLKSTTIALVENAKEKCGTGNEKRGCCKTKFHTLKVKDTHIASYAINNNIKHFSEIIIFNPSFESIGLGQQQAVVNNPSHAPPLHQGTPLYILNCIYRI